MVHEPRDGPPIGAIPREETPDGPARPGLWGTHGTTPWDGDPLVRSGLLLLRRMDAFLQARSQGLPYAPEERALEPWSEVVRLLVVPQALGYLELHDLTNERHWLREAEKRLRWIAEIGDSAFRGAGLDGLVGWAHLRAFESTQEPFYLEQGLAVADRCLGYDDDIPNWAYASALNLGTAHSLTGRSAYQDAARILTRRVASLQFPDGSFPHRNGREFGKNSPYTAWLAFEMIQHRRSDPEDPEMDPAILKAAAFLARRVEPDGSLNYQDSDGAYDANGLDVDCRGWMNELPTAAFVMEATGRRPLAARLLGFLSAQESRGPERGGFADKWGYPDTSSAWATGDPSVVRTSLVFWQLSAFLNATRAVGNGVSRECLITPADCHASFRDLGMCDAGLPGHDVRIDGRPTGCLDEELVRYGYRDTCDLGMTCEYHRTLGAFLVTTCPTLGDRKCIAWACEDTCRNPYPAACTKAWSRGDPCLGTATRERLAPDTPGPTDPATLARVGPEIRSLEPGPGPGSITLVFTLGMATGARCVVFDVAGRLVARRELGWLPAGLHRATLGAMLPSGVYLLRLEGGRDADVRRVTVIR